MPAHVFQPHPTQVVNVFDATPRYLCQVCGTTADDGDHVPAVQEATADLHPTAPFRAAMRATPPAPPTLPNPHDLVLWLYRQQAFSQRTFGPGPRTAALLDHIRRELSEIAAAPTDLMEWIDVVTLALDGAWRAGHPPHAIAEALDEKLRINMARTWPDWRTTDPACAITHQEEPQP